MKLPLHSHQQNTLAQIRERDSGGGGRFGYDYWKTIAQDCFGIPTVKLLKAENLDIVGADAEKIVDDAIKAYGLA